MVWSSESCFGNLFLIIHTETVGLAILAVSLQRDNFCLYYVKMKGKFNPFNFTKHTDLCLQVFHP